MPVKIKKVGSKYQVSTPNHLMAKGTTKAKAEKQRNLINALDHGWKPKGVAAESASSRTARLLKSIVECDGECLRCGEPLDHSESAHKLICKACLGVHESEFDAWDHEPRGSSKFGKAMKDKDIYHKPGKTIDVSDDTKKLPKGWTIEQDGGLWIAYDEKGKRVPNAATGSRPGTMAQALKAAKNLKEADGRPVVRITKEQALNALPKYGPNKIEKALRTLNLLDTAVNRRAFEKALGRHL